MKSEHEDEKVLEGFYAYVGNSIRRIVLNNLMILMKNWQIWRIQMNFILGLILI